LAGTLNISKPAVTRGVDRLEELDLALRRGDPEDRRSVLIMPTDSGRAFVKELGEMMRAASKPRSVVPADVKARMST
jgi:DNA-binding MarR family transcriptional regulator